MWREAISSELISWFTIINKSSFCLPEYSKMATRWQPGGYIDALSSILNKLNNCRNLIFHHSRNIAENPRVINNVGVTAPTYDSV